MDLNKINSHILFSQKLLNILENNQNLLEEDNLIKLGKNMFPNLSNNEFIDNLRTLDRVNVIDFENKDDLFNIEVDNFIWIYLNKEKLSEFIKLAKEDFHGLNIEDKEIIISILKKLYSLTHTQYKKNNQIIIEKLKEKNFLEEKDIRTIEWIDDYTGFIKIIYKLEADFDIDELGRNIPVGAGEFPKEVKIIDIDGLQKLYEKLKKELLLSEGKQIKLVDLKNNIEWRCTKCSRFLDKLTSKEQIESYLLDFMIGKYKICHKCRTRNYFKIDSKGQIGFLMLKKNN